jgi:hypothetical protein
VNLFQLWYMKMGVIFILLSVFIVTQSDWYQNVPKHAVFYENKTLTKTQENWYENVIFLLGKQKCIVVDIP